MAKRLQAGRQRWVWAMCQSERAHEATPIDWLTDQLTSALAAATDVLSVGQWGTGAMKSRSKQPAVQPVSLSALAVCMCYLWLYACLFVRDTYTLFVLEFVRIRVRVRVLMYAFRLASLSKILPLTLSCLAADLLLLLQRAPLCFSLSLSLLLPL